MVKPSVIETTLHNGVTCSRVPVTCEVGKIFSFQRMTCNISKTVQDFMVHSFYES